MKDVHVEKTNTNFNPPAASRTHHRGLHRGSAVFQRPRTRTGSGAPSGRGRRRGGGGVEARVVRHPAPPWHPRLAGGESGRENRPGRGAVLLRRGPPPRGDR